MMQGVPGWTGELILVGIASARFGFAFIMIPLFGKDTIPATVRNGIILTFGGIAFALQPNFMVQNIGTFGWAAMLLREAGIGVAIGFFFGTILWAMQAAGEIVDAKVGATIGQLIDPNSGGQVSLTGALMERLAHVLFAASGGILLLVATIMESFAVWPIAQSWPRLDPHSMILFEGEFGRLMALALIFAAPILVMLYVVDAALGLLNRFAQQLNVFSLSLSIKSWAASALLLILVPLLAQAVIMDLSTRQDVVRSVARAFAR
ncbi:MULTISPECIES: type III secretion system export apparatus subunit SctT [Sphingobium]|jgi:type III secretion protein T|uniref:EscT/YscT/HrcT family type III secretion system export apparatus protein n=1 Tax=Sphingobium limneticum TaxID=1007511 RepID=A0A5J5IE28_9SPHN|nr:MULTISPECIES: type III secretion system export apparatus subunit SctT [Sphingobium]KAA9020128.1 EscT/YscT/HrcT family type III secretion system export apparatus protein [Sphingobium limneticum]KAA9021392.1 EscT/YscT/HrcT family type III secretion system export apparatus protein [Sphingobium limneticum]KAA9033754.1 EscT/YscT/HrcT family type III secretion system export apparatus protein [Sphingobium limneticum]BBD03217.1 type III secretion protein T [Sphingobium sp. YG1]